MTELLTQQDRRRVQKLPFCYLCGENFATGDATDYDHVPPEAVFEKADRAPLKLRSHVACNHQHHLIDEMIGQVIDLRRGTSPRPAHRRLKFKQTKIGTGLIEFDLHAAIWRWISGFHAALYREPLRFQVTGVDKAPFVRSLELPFSMGSTATLELDPIRPQHVKLVETIKVNRFHKNLDRIVSNNDKLVYECVWAKADADAGWLCVFALDVCDWKDLGAISTTSARGCAGCYMLDTRLTPPSATLEVTSRLILPNYDTLDPFAP